MPISLCYFVWLFIIIAEARLVSKAACVHYSYRGILWQHEYCKAPIPIDLILMMGYTFIFKKIIFHNPLLFIPQLKNTEYCSLSHATLFVSIIET